MICYWDCCGFRHWELSRVLWPFGMATFFSALSTSALKAQLNTITTCPKINLFSKAIKLYFIVEWCLENNMWVSKVLLTD